MMNEVKNNAMSCKGCIVYAVVAPVHEKLKFEIKARLDRCT